MKLIPLTQGKSAKVDDSDYENLSKVKWYARKDGNRMYAQRTVRLSATKTKAIGMHNAIMEPPEGKLVDHINGDSLDNRRSNLRVCTFGENLLNKAIYANNKSGYRGVGFHVATGKWQAYIRVNDKQVYLGLHSNPEDAAQAYNDASGRLHGSFGRLNKLEKTA